MAKTKQELEAKQNHIEQLEAQVVFEEITFGETDLTVNDVMDIINAWGVLSERLEIVTPVYYCDDKPIHMAPYIHLSSYIDYAVRTKEFKIVKKAMGIKSCQSK